MAMVRKKNQAEIAAMREGGRMLATVLELLRTSVKAGHSTKELADMARDELRRLGGQPSFLGYQGFPDVICISVNDEVVHGIPRRDHIVKSGDIITFDFGVTYQGLITDGAVSVIVDGPKQSAHKELLQLTEAALHAGIGCVKHGVKTGDIGATIEASIDQRRYGIVRDLVGHGVGHAVHESPDVPNYGRKGSGVVLEAGMTIAVEPMITLGSDHVTIDQDGWTIRTRDGSWAAQFEHTILITDDGAEILTTLS